MPWSPTPPPRQPRPPPPASRPPTPCRRRWLPAAAPRARSAPASGPRSEVGHDRGEDLVDAGGVRGVVGGGVGRVGYPPQRVEIGVLAVPDREQPHRLRSLLGADLAEKV